MIPVFRRYTLLTVASCLALPLHAQVSPTLGDQELQRQQQRERLRQEQAEQRPDVRLMLDAPKPMPSIRPPKRRARPSTTSCCKGPAPPLINGP
jgi:hemolysin activation/secretion protein